MAILKAEKSGRRRYKVEVPAVESHTRNLSEGLTKPD